MTITQKRRLEIAKELFDGCGWVEHRRLTGPVSNAKWVAVHIENIKHSVIQTFRLHELVAWIDGLLARCPQLCRLLEKLPQLWPW